MAKALIEFLNERERTNLPIYPVIRADFQQNNDENKDFDTVLYYNQMLSTPEYNDNVWCSIIITIYE